MKLVEQLSNFEYDLRDKIERVLDSDKESLAQLKEELCLFRSAYDISFSAKDGHLFIHYTNRVWMGGDCEEITRVQLPDLFVEDFEEFMRSSK